MKCPKCSAQMGQVAYEGVVADRCSDCKGIWFDAGESETFRSKKLAAAIDTGDPKRGKELNKLDHYPCPRCSGGMVRMVDAKQPHIWYEQCGACGGAYFDAGEFTDLSSTTIVDFIKRWTTPERS